jgi:hypothetical protein
LIVTRTGARTFPNSAFGSKGTSKPRAAPSDSISTSNLTSIARPSAA